MNKILEALFRILFEKTPILSWANGHKKSISIVIVIISGALGVAHKLFPELAAIDQINSYYILLAGLLGYQVADFHDEIKDGKLNVGK